MSRLGISNGPLYVRRPFFVIEAIVATAVIVGGLYVMSPFFIAAVGANSGALSAAFTNETSRIAVGFLYLVPGLTVWAGMLLSRKDNVKAQIAAKKLRKWGLFSSFCIILFFQILGILTNGIRPIIWLYPMAVALIAAYTWVIVRWEDKHGS